MPLWLIVASIVGAALVVVTNLSMITWIATEVREAVQYMFLEPAAGTSVIDSSKHP